MKTGLVILAAGKGTRMKSKRAKVLHPLIDKPMIDYVLEAGQDLADGRPLLVVGHQKEAIKEALGDRVDYVWQKEQKGTGHALMVAVQALGDVDRVLVVCGDTPLVRKASLEALVSEHLEEKNQATVLSVSMEDPAGYGRLVRRPDQRLERIVEDKDASLEERAIQEINSGMYVFELEPLRKALDELSDDNAQGEYYLTDLIEIMSGAGARVGAYLHPDAQEIMGINDRRQLAEASRILQERILDKWLEAGVTINNTSCACIGSDVILAEDVEIGPNVILEGRTQIGRGTRIVANSRLTSALVGQDCLIDSSVVVDSKMGDGCLIGPFAYIRPSSELLDRVKIGDFVEIKKSRVDSGSKIPHHSYIGDALVGKKVNVGAGTITCNYDGTNKYTTVIDDGVFIGSNSNLVAPVHIEKGAYVAAGSTITEDVPSRALSLGRARQRNIEGWRDKKGL